MSTDERGHLNPEELVSSVVDGEDMGPSVRRHLETCPECSRQRQLIMDDLRALKWSAKRFSPEPARKVRLSSRESQRAPARPYGWVAGWSFAAVAAASLILILSPGHLNIPAPLPGITPASASAADDASLMEEVSRLEEDSLPDGYREICPEEPADVDDDPTLDLLAPIDDDGGLS